MVGDGDGEGVGEGDGGNRAWQRERGKQSSQL